MLLARRIRQLKHKFIFMQRYVTSYLYACMFGKKRGNCRITNLGHYIPLMLLQLKFFV
jgi:hypothetical protein